MYLDEARRVIAKEMEGLSQLLSILGPSFDQAVELIVDCTHHVVISGMGKGGLIGTKIAATLASTGTPSFFMHPGEAIHGDLGMLRKEDVVILMSYSGETEEITRLLPMLKVVGNKTIAMTKSKTSTLGRNTDVVLELGNLEEACPMGLAPTTSTTAMLALGDALAIVLLKIHDFDEKQYAFFHPGGALGKKLLTVKDLMRTDDRCPILSEDLSVKEVILSVSSARAGSAILVSPDGILSGVFTDGDLRRHLNRSLVFMDSPVSEVMTRNPKYVEDSVYALEAVGLMKEFMIGELPVVDANRKPQGLLDLKDLVNIGLLDL
jgi:arabinose-5-phosphate isomerase